MSMRSKHANTNPETTLRSTHTRNLQQPIDPKLLQDALLLGLDKEPPRESERVRRQLPDTRLDPALSVLPSCACLQRGREGDRRVPFRAGNDVQAAGCEEDVMRVDGRREEGQVKHVELVERLGRWCAWESEELMLVGERKKGRFC